MKKPNKDYEILCRSIKLGHMGIMNWYFKNKMFHILEYNQKHMLWFMKFAKKNNIMFKDER